ncbi:putative 2,5-diamino-6-ribosylamino-4(3H)-pyrimidinone 5'-phosphate reductase [Colletotrichum tanaceti]|uniref:2,5-diamino-6-ribosylamino-4(3H)-pyrimidinone 5'-phosphate reductase n=1 Tax=Colletotrichum tanaceti TaxID=1306861 RepID=A0A4U6XL16_9PEZI|nr:putative 2,5-diamino-6-ribosylamino-4(3H)-pyrimidinone 5'-phosphate reductase [Colletotrichum tanaceti]TKW56328.1 putative 2,5-diamino-6-ribosylamino-4(3H)-pyrimidinone 5'-phosphate reductase [Colletotrichum tanaceti]
MAETLQIPDEDVAWLSPHLPSESAIQSAGYQNRPFVTLTFATSLDSSLSLAPGVRTRLSGPESKAMTHYLRRQHAAILVGVGTVLADDPGLNCRISGAGLDAQPRPVVLDPRGRWDFTERSKVFEIARAGKGLAPFVLIGAAAIDSERQQVLEAHGGKFVVLDTQEAQPRFDWPSILSVLHDEGLDSVMIEGGGQVINSLLSPEYHQLVDAVIVTLAPTWLGRGGVVVSPDRVHTSEGTPVPAARLADAAWHQFGEDIVLCGKLGRGD